MTGCQMLCSSRTILMREPCSQPSAMRAQDSWNSEAVFTSGVCGIGSRWLVLPVPLVPGYAHLQGRGQQTMQHVCLGNIWILRIDTAPRRPPSASDSPDCE